MSEPDTPPALDAPAADASIPTWQTAGSQGWSGGSAGGLFGTSSSNSSGGGYEPAASSDGLCSLWG